jgi:hypothetical protein
MSHWGAFAFGDRLVRVDAIGSKPTAAGPGGKRPEGTLPRRKNRFSRLLVFCAAWGLNPRRSSLAKNWLMLSAGEPRILEPGKCTAIGWFRLENLPAPLSVITQANVATYQARREFGSAAL